MIRKRLILSSFLVMALLLFLTGSFVPAQADNGQGHDSDRILVKFRSGTPEGEKGAAHSKHGGRLVDVIPGIDVQVVSVPKNTATDKVKAYKGERNVEFAEPDYIAKAIPPVTPSYTPNDELYRSLGQWGIDKIQAPQAWDITKGSSTVKIAILDTGIDQDHDDLAGKLVDNKNFTSSANADDYYGHGTHVAGIAAAITDNGKGVAGVGFNSSLLNVKVLGDDGSGYYSWVANGIIYAANNGAKVINMSLGGPVGSSTLQLAVNDAWNKGAVLVAAAGNDGRSARSYPAYYSNVIAVAATDQNDAKASFSNFGTWVDIAAPGVNILSTFPNHTNYFGNIYNYAYWGGTSMSTPHVAGVAALVWATGYGTSNTAVRGRVLNTADKAGTMYSKYRIKRLNAYNAVK